MAVGLDAGVRPDGSVRRRAALSFADHAVSSLSNIALTLLVAHALPLAEFGSYALLLAAYQVGVALGQALVGEPLLVLSARLVPGAERGALGLSVLLGAAALPVLGIAAPAGYATPAVVALGLLMPGLLVQDALRYVAFSRRRPGLALLSDAVWAIGQLAGTAVVLARGDVTVALLVLAWGLPAVLAAGISAAALRVLPAPGRARAWFGTTRHLGRQYVGEAVTNLGAFQAVLYLTGALAGVAAAGQLRIVQVLFGPVHVAVTAARAFGIPDVSRRLAAGTGYARVVRTTSVALGGFALLWTVLLGVVPAGWGGALLGSGWSATAGLVWILGAQKALESAAVGPFLVHRAKERARWTFHVRAAGTATTLGATLLLARPYGPSGASWAMLLGSVVAVTAWWSRYLAADAPAALAAGRARQHDRREAAA